MSEVAGYPPVLIPIVLIIGFFLSPLRPYLGFMFAVSILTAADVAMFNQTRTALLGPFLNLADVCVIVALASLFFDKYRNKEGYQLPTIVAMLAAVLLISAMQSFWKFGWTYETLRAFRWALDVPIAFFVGANIVTSPKRARYLVTALFCGAVLAALQHFAFVAMLWRTKALNMETYAQMRTISFWGGCLASAFLLAAVVWRLPRDPRKKMLCAAAGVLFVATILLNQTRSLWLATLMGIPVIAFFLGQKDILRTAMRIGIGTAAAAVLLVAIGRSVMPGLDVAEIINKRFATFLESDPSVAGTASRENAFRIEMQNWMEGTLIFGRGLNFFQTVKNPRADQRHMAFAHLGYVTYLSQTGLLGLLVYGLFLPLGVVRNGRWLWTYGGLPELQFVGALSVASILCLSIMFMASSHFLNLGYFAPAALYGGAWALARSCRASVYRSGNDVVAQLE